jgi:hypothetical protein
MDPSRTIGIVALVLSVPQGFAALFQIIDRINSKKRRTWILAGFLFLSTLTCIVFGSWILFADPFRPIIKEKTVNVEKLVPCPVPPPTKSGAATTRGAQSPAITGSGNPVTYGQPVGGQPASPKKE